MRQQKEDVGQHCLVFPVQATESWNSAEVAELGARNWLAFRVFHPHLRIPS